MTEWLDITKSRSIYKDNQKGFPISATKLSQINTESTVF